MAHKGFLALALLAAIAGASPADAACTGDLRGRRLELPQGIAGFGKVQGQPPLPLARGEYVLTIDDGPNPATTPKLLQILKDYCVNATFFLVGRRAEAQPQLVASILAAGQTVGSHSFTHPDLSRLAEPQIEDEIRKGDAAVQAAAGSARPARHLFRLPGSAGFPNVPPPTILQFLKEQDLVLAGYDFSPQDWRNRPPQESLATLLQGLGDRGVILFHDGQPNTIPLLPMVLDELGRRNAKIVQLAF